MRVIGEIAHPEMKVTLYQWNNKFLVKFEQGFFEQTYKVSELDVAGEEELRSLITEEFSAKVLTRFKEMGRDWSEIMW